MNQSERRTILIQVLLKEHPEYRGLRIPADADTQWQLLRGLLNIREPRRIGTDFLQIQDEYRSCLELAAENRLESMAFCCISTGEFHFPNQLAAEIAVQTVKEFLKKQTSVKKVIFNVFKDMDKKIYERLLRTD